MSKRASTVLFVLSLLFVSQGYAQLNGLDRGNPNWFLRVRPYLWLSNIDTEETLEVGHGEHVIGDFFVPVGDTVLENSWAVNLEFGKRRIRGIINLQGANLNTKNSPRTFYSYPDSGITRPGTHDLDWFTGEFFIAAQVGPFKTSHGFEIYTGLRYMHQKQVLQIQEFLPEPSEVTQSWIDPVIGARLFTELGKRWWAMFHSDIGGFGVGTDFTWSMGGELGFRIFKPLDITMRYNYQEIEYDNEKTGAERFIWRNGVQQGWYFGLQFKL